ncbi:MAG: DUF1176 domain-containing protein [Ahrensia sp.]
MTIRRGLWLASLLGVLSSLMMASALANQFKRINDVNVSCTNSLQCDLFITDPRVTLYTFALRRGAAEQAAMSLVLATRQPLASGSEVALRIDGHDVARFTQQALSYRAAVYEYVRRDTEIVDAVLAATSNGRLLQVEYTTRGGQTAANFGLSGFVEGLRFADAVQGRQGAANAWSRFAGQGGVAPTMGSAVISRFDDVPFLIRSRFFRRGDALCAGADTEGAGFNGAFSISAGDVALYALPCGPSTPEDRAFSLFELEGGELTALAFPVMTGQGPTVRYRVPNLVWDAATTTLISDGIADNCAQKHIWSVGGAAPLRLTLTSSDVAEECGEAVQSWPVGQ